MAIEVHSAVSNNTIELRGPLDSKRAGAIRSSYLCLTNEPRPCLALPCMKFAGGFSRGKGMDASRGPAESRPSNPCAA